MQPRWYQTGAINETWDWIRHNEGNPCIVLPTGAGKSVVIAGLIYDLDRWGKRSIMLCHRQELVSQNAKAVERLTPGMQIGLYCAGLKKRELDARHTMAGIQSVHTKAWDFGKLDAILVDEAHLIPVKESGMFRRFIADATTANPSLRVIGLTATPYRMSEGMVCGNGGLFDEISYEVKINELIPEYLSNLTSKRTEVEYSAKDVSVRGGEWVSSELQEVMSGDEAKVAKACQEIVAKTSDRSSVLIFTCGVSHGKMVQSHLPDAETRYLDGSTPKAEREQILEEFQNRAFKYLVNIDVLTTGFDAPNIDCVALLRPTLSAGLLYQMVGRGLRKCEGKKDCLILDFARNIDTHGPIDMIQPEAKRKGDGSNDAPTKVCPKCDEKLHASVRYCPQCDHKFPDPEIKHETTASEQAPLSRQAEELQPMHSPHVEYAIHKKRGAGENHPRSLRVTYSSGFIRMSEFVNLEHEGYAKKKAEKWWSDRCAIEMPETAAEAVLIAEQGWVASPKVILYGKDGKYFRVDSALLRDIPEAPTPEEYEKAMGTLGLIKTTFDCSVTAIESNNKNQTDWDYEPPTF